MNQLLEQEKNFQCIHQDGQAEYAVYDPQLLLFCKNCHTNINATRQNLTALKLQDALKKVEEKQILVEKKINSQKDKLSELIKSAEDFESQFLRVFNLLITNLESWKEALLIMNKNSNQLQELSNLVAKQPTLFENLFTSNNNTYISKLCDCFKEFNLVYEKEQKNFSILLNQLIKETQVPKTDTEIELKMNQQVPQKEACLNLAFNSSDSLMISTKFRDIQTWKFDQGKITMLQTLNMHKDWVNCIVYSKSQEVFFSGSDDKTIRIWKLKNNSWTSSEHVTKHQVFCLLLNSKEDQLFSGGSDYQIIVWKVNQEMNELTQLYELGKHKCSVLSISLNQSETILVSCSNLKSEIIVWEKGQDNTMKFKQFVKQMQSQNYFGKKVFFLSENYFIWVTAIKEADNIFVFERKNGCFQENSEQTIELIQDKENEDMFQFPIIKEKNTQLIILRHKTHIYFLKDFGLGKLKILHQLDCRTISIYGTITNNLQYLLYWDNQTNCYSVYEIKISERLVHQ